MDAKKMEAKKMEDQYLNLVKYSQSLNEELLIRLYESGEKLTVQTILGRGAFGVVYKCLDSD